MTGAGIFRKNLRELGTEWEQGCRTGPPDYIPAESIPWKSVADPGCLSRIPENPYAGSRILGSKRHRFPDRNTALKSIPGLL
jgi:hypothetical protein